MVNIGELAKMDNCLDKLVSCTSSVECIWSLINFSFLIWYFVKTASHASIIKPIKINEIVTTLLLKDDRMVFIFLIITLG